MLLKGAVMLMLVVSVMTAPQETSNEAQAKIISDTRSVEKDRFAYSYEIDNGVKVEASGENKEIGEAAGMTMSGSYSFIAPDGNTYTVTWVSDENGFQPTVSIGEQ